MKNLRLLRKKKGLSQQRLAELLNVSQQSIHKYENGISEPDIQTLKEMADLFHTSIDYIVGNTDCPNKIEYVAETALNKEELNHLRMYRELSSKRRELVDMLMEDYTKEKP